MEVENVAEEDHDVGWDRQIGDASPAEVAEEGCDERCYVGYSAGGSGVVAGEQETSEAVVVEGMEAAQAWAEPDMESEA